MSGSVDFKIPLKVPLEALSYRFRKLQKHLSKEVESEIKNIKALKDNFSEEECAAIRNRLEHLRSLTLTSDIGEKEYIAKMQSRARVAAEQSLTAEDKTVLLVADYLLRLREFDCVERIVAEYGGGGWLEQHLDIAEHREAHAVEEAVSSGDLTTALNWCQSHASKLRRVNSVLEFYLAQEQFLDFVYENNPQEALQFAQSHLAGLINAGTDPKTPVKTNPHVAGDTSKAKSDDKRLRSSSMGTYPSRPVDGMTSSAKSGTVAVAPAAIPSFDQFGANSNTAAGAINSSAFTQVDGDTELKNELRHLTGLLVYPSTSPEVINHPRYAPSLRHARLQSILELFRTDFRKVYGFPEVSPLETYLTTGIAVLKTPTCTASFLNGCELRSPSEDDISPSTSADRSIPSSRRNRGSVVGAALNRLLAGVDNRGAWTDNALSSEGQQRSNGRFFSGFSNIGGFLNISSRRTRSQSMSAVEETFQRVGTVAGIHGSSGSGNNMDILVAVARRQCDQTDGARAHSSATSNAQSMDLADDNGDQTSPHVMPEHPCYHPSRQHTACEAKEIKLSGGKRRAEECPVCSFEGGVGPDLACAVPSFNSPVSVLVCRGSGVVMSHENPPMALPNGQVFSRNFLLATAIKQEAPVKVSTPTASASRDTSVYRRELSSPVGYRFTNSARASTQAHARGASEREESRWSVLRSLAARSVARDISNSRHSAARSAQHSIAEQATLDVSRTQPTSAPRPNVSVGPAIDTTSSQAAAVQQASAHVVLTRGADGILRSRSDAAVAIAAPLLQVSPIRHDIQQDSSPVQVHRAPSSSTPHTSLMEDGSDSNDSFEEEDEMDEDIEEEEEEEEDRYSDNAEEEEYMEEVDEEQQEEEEEEEEEINLRTAVNNWRERRSAAEPSYRQDETRMDTSSGRRSSQERSSSDSSADNNLPMETVLMAVCPITGDRFEFSKLRTVFLA